MTIENPFSISYDIPRSTKFLTHQLAGHVHGKGSKKLGVLKHEDGHLLKPLTPARKKNYRELDFYQNVSATDDPILSQLSCFIPKFYGTWVGMVNGTKIRYLCLEDIADNFKIPCNLDLKVGARTYDPLADDEKRNYEIQKYPEAKTIGFRILGMRVFNATTLEFLSFGKDFGKKQTLSTVANALHMYLNEDTSSVAVLILSGFIHSLKAIESWFSLQRQLVFYASSLLFFYEAEIGAWISFFQDLNAEIHFSDKSLENFVYLHQSFASRKNYGFCNSSRNKTLERYMCHILLKIHLCSDKTDICSICNLNNVICSKIRSSFWLVDVRMVDFTHVFFTENEDENYLFGLHKIIDNFKVLYNKILRDNSLF